MYFSFCIVGLDFLLYVRAILCLELLAHLLKGSLLAMIMSMPSMPMCIYLWVDQNDQNSVPYMCLTHLSSLKGTGVHSLNESEPTEAAQDPPYLI